MAFSKLIESNKDITVDEVSAILKVLPEHFQEVYPEGANINEDGWDAAYVFIRKPKNKRFSIKGNAFNIEIADDIIQHIKMGLEKNGHTVDVSRLIPWWENVKK